MSKLWSRREIGEPINVSEWRMLWKFANAAPRWITYAEYKALTA